jgi:hypothetical protein
MSKIFPALNDTHVDHLDWAVNTFGEAWLHGSGDIFVDTYPDPEHKQFKVTAEENSNNAFNKASEHFSHSATKKYRKKYVKGDKLPSSVEEMEAELQKAKTEEQTKKMTENQTIREVPVFTPKVKEVDAPAVEEKKN